MSIPFIDLKSQYQHLKPMIDANIQKVLDHGQYIMGPEVAQLESELAAYTESPFTIGVCDGTKALLIAMMALDIGPGDEVITTPFTFIATGEMIALLGATPVFVDIDPISYNLDPQLLERAISPKTKAIMPVSLYGQCADFSRINEIAERHNIVVIEDGAQSFGASVSGVRSGNLSTIATTSFFPSKPLGCYGDGGAIFTKDEKLAKRMREIRIHGQDRRYHHPVIGLNGRLDTLQAAILLAKLPSFPAEVEARSRIGARYTEALKDYVRTPVVLDGYTHVYAQYTVEVDNRSKVQEILSGLGVPTAVHYPIPLHLQPVFASLGYEVGSFPVAERAASRVMSLPMHPFLTQENQNYIVESLKQAVSQC